LTCFRLLVSIPVELNPWPKRKKQSYDVIVIGSGIWAAGLQASRGSRPEGRAARSGRPQSDKNFTEHKPAFELKYRNMARKSSQDAPIQVKFGVCNDSPTTGSSTISKSLIQRLRQAFNWMGRLRMTGDAPTCGPREPALQRLGFQGRLARRFGEDWRSVTKTSSPITTSLKIRRHHRQREGLEHLPDGQFSSGSAHLSGKLLPQSRQGKAWPHRNAHARREFNQAHPRPRPLPFLWPLRTRLHDALVLQFRVHHRRRRVASGNCTLISNAMVHKVLMDPERNRAAAFFMSIASRASPVKSPRAPSFFARNRRSPFESC